MTNDTPTDRPTVAQSLTVTKAGARKLAARGWTIVEVAWIDAPVKYIGFPLLADALEDVNRAERAWRDRGAEYIVLRDTPNALRIQGRNTMPIAFYNVQQGDPSGVARAIDGKRLYIVEVSERGRAMFRTAYRATSKVKAIAMCKAEHSTIVGLKFNVVEEGE
jgi:hypothetical protein